MKQFPVLDTQGGADTRDAIQAYAEVLGAWLRLCRPRRKYDWHESLRPSLNGITTGVARAGIGFELNLNLRANYLHGLTADGADLCVPLRGQAQHEIAQEVDDFLLTNGLDCHHMPNHPSLRQVEFPGYSAEHGYLLAAVIDAVSAAMEDFRSMIPEETSPVQVWPRHLHLCLQWLPGGDSGAVSGGNGIASAKPFSFGFSFADTVIQQPYFFVRADPAFVDAKTIQLPSGSNWHTEKFAGLVLPYKLLTDSRAPGDYLFSFWDSILHAARGYSRRSESLAAATA